MPFRIVYKPDAVDDLRALSRTKQVLVEAEVRRLLTDQPTQLSHKRAPMRPNPFFAGWELRLGSVRVYYDVTDEPEPTVTILRVGEKIRERVRIRGEFVELTQ